MSNPSSQGRDRATILGKQPARIHPVAGADIGRMVARAFDVEEAAGHTFTIHGPEETTMRAWLEDYCALVKPHVKVKSVPLWLLSLIAVVTRNRTLRAAVTLMRYFEPLPELGDPREANELLGAPRITLRQWVESRRHG